MSRNRKNRNRGRRADTPEPAAPQERWYGKATKYVAAGVASAVLGAVGVWAWTTYGQPLADKATDPLNVTVVSVPRPKPSIRLPIPSLAAPSLAVPSLAAPSPSPQPAGLREVTRESFSYPLADQWVFAEEVPHEAVEDIYRAFGKPGHEDDEGPASQLLDSWATREGGYNVETTVLRVVMQARNRPVTVVGVRAEIVERHPIPTGTVVLVPPQGGADTLRTDLRLDDPEPTAEYFAGHTVTLAPNESVTLDITAEALRTAVVWDLVLDLVVAGDGQSMTLTRTDGRHFRTAGWPDHQHHRDGPSGMNDPPAPWQRYSHAFVFDVSALEFDDRGKPLLQDAADIWKRCTGADLQNSSCLAPR